MDHRLFRRLFLIACSVANVLLLCGCASNRGTEGVGAPIVIAPAVRIAPSDELAQNGLVVVTWNIHEGRGDIAALVASLRPAHVVLLLQEATRRTLPSAIGSLGLFAAYAPSMPNGRRDDGDDRGCAILSSLPIDAIDSVELPWVYQRRVALAGTITARLRGEVFAIRVVSAHLDNRPGRKRQARWLARWLQPSAAAATPLVVGADLNTWFGAREQTVRAIDAVVPRALECGDRPTFRFGLRLDYLFTTLPQSMHPRCDILPATFGSDHHPVVLRLLR